MAVPPMSFLSNLACSQFIVLWLYLLEKHGVEMTAPHRRGWKKPKAQDGRKLRRHERRWKVERLFAWLQNFRRLAVRYERHADNFSAFLLLACSVILLRFFEISSGSCIQTSGMSAAPEIPAAEIFSKAACQQNSKFISESFCLTDFQQA